MTNRELSEDTLAVLLLCGRFGGEKQDPFQPLSPREYGALAVWLLSQSIRPSDLVGGMGNEVLSSVHQSRLERKRIEFLLGRGTAMALALERWSRSGLWVISRGDSAYPKRLKQHFKQATPPLLYGAGDKSLLDHGGLAIIGSRDASQSALEYTQRVASRCASEGFAVISGGARGVDVAAMQGATEVGGTCIGVLASDLLKASVNRQNRVGLQEGQLVLVTPFYPEAGFNAGNAMGRNRYIYTLADQALVIDSALRSGGTWEGAVENLKHRWVPLFVRSPGEGAGNAALIAEGGLPFDDTTLSPGGLVEFIRRPKAKEDASPDTIKDRQLAFPRPDTPIESEANGTIPVSVTDCNVKQERESAESSDDGGSAVEQSRATDETRSSQQWSSSTLGPLDMYGDFAAKLVTMLTGAELSEEEVAQRLFIEKSQAKVWLKRACDARLVEKTKKPVRYILHRQQGFKC